MARREGSIPLMNRLAAPLALLGLTALAACNSSPEGADPGPVTQEEAQALEDAASMLDEQRMPAEGTQENSPTTDGESE